MTGVAVVGDDGMRAGKWINAVVIEDGRYPGRFAVAGGAVRGELLCDVVGVSGLVIVRRVAARTGVRRIIVVAVVAGRTVVGDSRMCAVQRVIIIVDGKNSRRPAGGRMAGCAIGRYGESRMVWIIALIIIRRMAGRTLRRSAGIPRGVALGTIHPQVRARQREIGLSVVKNIVRISGRVTC